MKTKFLPILFIAVFSTGLFAQQNVTNEKHERVLAHIEDNIFSVKFYNAEGAVVQEGQYWKEGDLFKPHGKWALYSSIDGDIVTTSTFDKGERISVETVIDGKVVKADKQQLAIKQIEQQIDQLEKRLADLEEN
ncbi:MAG: hypothetical protein JJ953_04810 [Gracilimonas sp.]|uniref:hypothetical protein n=1 Tax=Gracilimonas TaxID=649462 RepID=UPI001B1E5CD9|nr:hypothetical protein [Gracilimonas sp.]MBO6585403.1 hypothetical protein [Gracilimonas sp.]MBO6616399.1 hypothetical protein [Gracilimonas sp.]